MAVGLTNPELVKILLSFGADVNLADETGHTPLLEAISTAPCSTCDFEILQELINRGAEVNKPASSSKFSLKESREQVYPLTEAVSRNQNSEAVVRVLLDAGADVKVPSNFITPLQKAVLVGNHILVALFLALGAEMNAPAAGLGGRTAIQAAVQNEDKILVQELVSRGADVNGLPAREGGATALDLALENNDLQTVIFLLEHGATVNAAAFRIIPHRAMQNDYTTLAQELLSKSADGTLKRAALHTAVKNDDIALIQDLLSRGADVEGLPAENGGKTALQLAIERNSIPIARLLIERGANVNADAAQMFGRTPLQGAVEQQDMSLVRELILRGADVNGPPAAEAGATALQLAAMKGNLPIAALLLEHGGDVNAAAALSDGRTALEGAAEQGRLDMVHLLLANDKNDATLKDRCQAAAEFAGNEGHERIAKTLKAWR